MMTEKHLKDALAAEQEELLAKIGAEPGFITQANGLFSGQAGWVSLVLMFAQAGLFAFGVWAGWQFYQADTVLTALHWGLPAITALLMALMIKLALWPQIQANRVIREIRRLELVLSKAG
jgi:hypothetical protein